MKLSVASLLLPLVSLPSLVAGLSHAPTDVVVDPVADNGDSTVTDGIVSMTIPGLKKQTLSPGDIEFITSALKRAYNTVHARVEDDLFLLHSNVTSIEVSKDAALSTTDLILGSLYDTKGDEEDKSAHQGLDWFRYGKYRYRVFWKVDIICYFCSKEDDDAVELSSVPIWSHTQEISDAFCSILKHEGHEDLFETAHACSLSPLTLSEGWEDKHEVAEVDSPRVSISLEGLKCAEDHDACKSEDVRQTVSDAFAVAFNKVHFHDYILRDFSPDSLVLYTVEGETKSTGSLRGRGNAAPDRVVMASWRGNLNTECRFCDPLKAGKSSFITKIGQVEEIFCGLMTRFTVDQNMTPSKFEACAVGVMQPVDITDSNEQGAMVKQG